MLATAARGFARAARRGTMRMARVITPEIGARRSLAVGRVQILCFHSIPPAQAFSELLGALRRDHEVIPYREAVERIVQGRLERPALALSFDDGLKSQREAARVVEEAGSRACFFVCTAGLGAGPDEAARFCRQNLKAGESELMNWDDLEALRRRGHEVGCHTHTHPNLAELSGQRLHEEIGASADLLRRRLGPIEHFAWPWGRWQHFSEAAARAVFDAGMTCASAERGCHRRPCTHPRALVLRRLVVDPFEQPWNVRIEMALAARAFWQESSPARPARFAAG